MSWKKINIGRNISIFNVFLLCMVIYFLFTQYLFMYIFVKIINIFSYFFIFSYWYIYTYNKRSFYCQQLRPTCYIFLSLVSFSRRHGYRAVLINMLFSSANAHTMFISAWSILDVTVESLGVKIDILSCFYRGSGNTSNAFLQMQ